MAGRQDSRTNEVAWCGWRRSPPSAEYERALTEVLRINPAHQQARQLLAEYREQYSALPPAQPLGTPPYAAQPGPQPAPQTPPPAQYPAPPYGYPAAPGGYMPEYTPPPAQPQPAPARGSRFPCCLLPMGCGCGGGCLRSCLLVVFLFVILPAVLCGVLSYVRFSFGPVDLAMTYLPGDFGRKDVSFTLETAGASSERPTSYEVSVTVPRSWFPRGRAESVVGDRARPCFDDFRSAGGSYRKVGRLWRGPRSRHAHNRRQYCRDRPHPAAGGGSRCC